MGAEESSTWPTGKAMVQRNALGSPDLRFWTPSSLRLFIEPTLKKDLDHREMILEGGGRAVGFLGFLCHSLSTADQPLIHPPASD